MQDKSTEHARKSPLLFLDLLKTQIIVNIFLSIFSGITTIGIAWSVGTFVPRILNGQTNEAKHFALFIIFFGLTRAVVAFFAEYENARSYISLTRTLRKRIISSLQKDRKQDSFSNKNHEATVLTSGLSALEAYVRQYVPSFVEGLLVPAIVLITICIVDLTSGLIIIATVPLVPIFMILIGKQTSDMTTRQWKGLSNLTNQFSTFLEGIPTLRMFGKQDRLVGHIEFLSQKYRKILMKTLRFAFLSAFALEAIASLSIAVVALTLGVRLIEGDVSLTAGLFVLFAIPECYWPLRRLGAAFHSAEAGKDAADDIFAILESTKTPGTAHGQTITGKIEVKNAQVISENGATRLDVDDISISEGAFIAITGSNGCGKSTLLKVLLGEIQLTHGEAFAGGTDLKEITSKSLAEQIAYVPQNFPLYGSTVAEAITWEAGSKKNQKLDSIAAELNIDDLLDQNPATLSGGQKQRVCIAHAIYSIDFRHTKLFVADEPTSQLDSTNAFKVVEVLKELAENNITVIIATHDSRIKSSFDETIDISNKELNKNSPLREQLEVAETTSGLASIHHAMQRKTIKEGTRFFRKISRQILSKSLLSIGVASLADLFTVALTGVALWLIVRAWEQPIFSELALAALFVRVCGVGKAVFRYIERLTTHAGALDLVAKLRVETTTRLIHLAPAGFPELKKGDLLGRVIDDHEKAQDLFIRSIIPAFSTLFTGVLCVVTMSFINVKAAIVLGICVIISGILIPATSIVLETRKRDSEADSQNEYTREICEFIDSKEILNSEKAQKFASSNIEAKAENFYKQIKVKSKRSGILRSCLVVIPSICVAITALLVPSSQGNLSDPLYGVILLSPFAVLAIFESHHRFGEVFTDGTSAWSRIYQIISRPLPISAPPTTRNISQDCISLSNATFRWDTKVPACENVSFELSEEIRHLTIEGPSGSGKSTLAAGLVRFLELQNGEYLYGDINVQNLNENDVREHIVWNPQSPWLLPGTIRENLLLSCGEASDETLFNALESVNGSDFVKKFKKGLDHNIGIDGELLSLGEKNKIALARIILSPHKIRIFDEPSASLDHLSTTKLIENIYSDSDAHFSIIISHELEEMGAGERLILSGPTSTVD